VIESLQALPNEVPPSGTINLVAIVSNRADINADQITTNVCVELYDYCSGLFTASAITKGDDVEGLCPRTAGGVTGISIKLLRGEKKQVEWILTAKDKAAVPVKTECNLKLRAMYEYRTESITTLHLIDYAEMQRRINEGTYKEVASYISTGYGPIKPYIRVEGTQPIPVTKDKINTALSLQISNKGQGYLSAGPGARAGTAGTGTASVTPHIDKAKVKIVALESTGNIESKLKDCLAGFDEEIRLIKGDSVKLVCPMVDVGVGNVPVDSTKTLKATLEEYWYEFRESIKVTVEPKF